ncbi:MAG TPA: cytochrome c biogenesis protein CcsA [Polyangia bacterium]|nr:cytochrome c biogenesis protein CcsA [Polyangia bacterium]
MSTLTVLELGAYALASVLYLGFLLGLRARAGRLALAAAVVLHVIDVGERCVHGVNPISSTPEALSFIGFLVATGYVLASLRYKLDSAGAFAAPAALVLLVLARLGPAEEATPAMSPLGQTHILLATIGVAIFFIAAVLAVLYLFEDRQLRRKDFAKMKGRATPLDTLDRLAAGCVSIGFPIFTVAIVTGAMWIARLGVLHGMRALRPEYLLAFVTWVAFGVLIVARVGGGWRGRRAAWLTLGGFGGTVLVLLVYFLRHAA